MPNSVVSSRQPDQVDLGHRLEPIRAKFRGMPLDQLVAALPRCRGFYRRPIVAETLVALKLLAERHRSLSQQIDTLNDARIDPLVTAFNPALRARLGIGTDAAAELDHSRPQLRPDDLRPARQAKGTTLRGRPSP